MSKAIFRITVISTFLLVTIVLPTAGRASPAAQPPPPPTKTPFPRVTKTPSLLPSNTRPPATYTPTTAETPTGTPTAARPTVQTPTETRVATSTESPPGAGGEVATQPIREPLSVGSSYWQDLLSISPLWLFCFACCAPLLLGFAGWSMLRSRGVPSPGSAQTPDDTIPSLGSQPASDIDDLSWGYDPPLDDQNPQPHDIMPSAGSDQTPEIGQSWGDQPPPDDIVPPPDDIMPS